MRFLLHYRGKNSSVPIIQWEGCPQVSKPMSSSLHADINYWNSYNLQGLSILTSAGVLIFTGLTNFNSVVVCLRAEEFVVCLGLHLTFVGGTRGISTPYNSKELAITIGLSRTTLSYT